MPTSVGELPKARLSQRYLNPTDETLFCQRQRDQRPLTRPESEHKRVSSQIANFCQAIAPTFTTICDNKCQPHL
ncbi:MAG: hypothetical protein AB4042_16340, partial [Leptolyngbyaceae cyanobacterium]